jgi:oxygen-independent coproporphyrinogen-3 oxidase
VFWLLTSKQKIGYTKKDLQKTEAGDLMKIQINGLEDSYKRSIELISQLFYEDVTIYMESHKDADILVSFTLKEAKRIQIEGSLDHTSLPEPLRDHYQKSTFEEIGSKEWAKKARHGVRYVYLTLLQKLTEIKQSWGTLTGIRPTKLLHNKVREKIPRDTAHQQLMDDYLISQEKVDLMQRIVDRQLDIVPDLYDLKSEVSIYIGIPFCPTKCAYCTFPAYAINGKQGSVNSFLGGLHYEMQKVGQWLSEKGIKITTVYFGGGTPTSITADEMDALYEEMYESFPHMEHVREVTVEAGRPDTITPEKLNVLKKWSIDRISINPQSYTEETLKAIGRHHSVKEIIEKFHLAREMGMNNINMDLIIGLPGEGIEEFKHTLAETERLMPESLTVHTLSFKRASEMTKNKEKYKVADRDEIIEMMTEAERWTEQHQYHPYYLYRQKNILGNLENVGYAKKGHESIYNIVIMEEQQPIIGLGCGASSKFVHPLTGKITRFANPKEPKAYNIGYEHYTEEKLRILSELFRHVNVKS